ncbi:50S ribosomal protein L9 [Gulosibacter bifidus]|uniref:Large ribosomal subunit protein bL9 n=1 Tax=Gulosibacter bifidus TaxID=272239 RepID=A0ABW5RJ39_9MICO|nr:50S ribosomal protein L9 [Gulosibacter bifidus]
MAKIILTQEVAGLGSAGDVVEVRNGFARNYLVPQGYAVNWTRGGESQVAQIKQAREARELKSVEEAQTLKQQLEGALVKIAVKSGAEGRLFGSVRTADVAEAVEAQGLGKIDKRKVVFPEQIKTIGTHEATVRLHEDVTATLKLQVIAKR